MNLALTVALAVSLLLAFSIGLNLGLHGVLSVGETTKFKQLNDNPASESTLSDSDKNSVESDKKFHPNDLEPEEPLLPILSPTITSVGEKSLNAVDSSAEGFQIDNSAQSALRVLHDIFEGKSVRDAVAAAESSSSKSNIVSFLEGGGKIPIVLLTCNRPEQLKVTLASLLAVRGVTKENLMIAQDGAMREVSEIVHGFGLKLLQNSEGLRLRGGAGGDGASRIAKHYKFSLSAAFDQMPLVPAIIIVEDDLLFSPDFYEFLTSTAPILENDPTTFVVSAWNDNGFKDRVSDQYALRRTEFFPGLGWLLPRELYKNELEQRWPNAHWDHWLRSVDVHGTRDIVYPEVPRTYHNGIVGTFMNMDTHNKYFRDIGYNTDESVHWDPKSQFRLHEGFPNYLTAVESVDAARVQALTGKCTHLNTFQELIDTTGVLCLWIDIDPSEPSYRPPEFQPISTFFQIWHEHRRGAHRGLHEFHWESKYVLVFNVRQVPGEKNYKALMPSSATLIDPATFDPSALVELKRNKSGVQSYAALAAGLTCDQVCAASGLTCRGDLLPLLNTCQALNEKFPCRKCVKSFGAEQPAFVSPDADEGSGPGTCVISSEPEKSICSSLHPSTFRLCACG